MKKKLVSALLIGVMAVSMLAGCGGSDAGAGSGSDAGAGSGSAAGGTEAGGTSGGGSGAATVTDGADPSTLEPYEIQMAFVGESYPDTDIIEGKINEIIQPKYNTTLNIIPMSWGEFTNKLNLMLSGDEQLDLVPCIGTSNGVTYMNNGQIIDIKGLYQTYAPDVAGVVGEDNVEICTVGGKMYGLPVYKEYSTVAGVMMRKDLLEASGHSVDEIKSLDDLDQIFADVKAQNPDMIMLAGRQGGTPGIDLITGGYFDGLNDNYGVILPDDKEGKVINYFETEEFKSVMTKMYEWAQAGYISKDCATMTDARQNQVKAGTAFAYFTPLKPGVDLQDSLDTTYEMVCAELSPTWRSTGQVAWIGWGIGRNCKYPERVLETFNEFYTNAEIMNYFNWGIEGQHYVFVDEEKGIITYPDGVDSQNKTYGYNAGYAIPNQKIAYVWENNDPSIWEEYETFNNADPLISTGFIFDNTAVSTEISALNNVYESYRDALGSGAVNPEEVLDDFNAELYNSGLQTVMDEKQKQLDAFLGK